MNPNPAIHIRFGSNFGPLTWTGEEWRLLTSAFLHFGILHIALNMFALYQGGGLVERLFGSTRFALIYLLSALSGSVASGWWDPLRNSAGASGAIFGVYGALLAFMAVRRADIPPSMLKSISSSALLFCLYSLVIGAAHPLIDNACHIGGLLGGFISGVILARPFTHRSARGAAAREVADCSAGHRIATGVDGAAADCREMAAMPPALLQSRPVRRSCRSKARLVRKQADILTFPPNAASIGWKSRSGCATKCSIPWREASRPMLQSATISQEDSRSARIAEVMRDYLRAREEAVALRVLALETGDLVG